jgi:hypothetical protein
MTHKCKTWLKCYRKKGVRENDFGGKTSFSSRKHPKCEREIALDLESFGRVFGHLPNYQLY